MSLQFKTGKDKEPRLNSLILKRVLEMLKSGVDQKN